MIFILIGQPRLFVLPVLRCCAPHGEMDVRRGRREPPFDGRKNRDHRFIEARSFPRPSTLSPLDDRMPRAMRTPATFAGTRESVRFGISASTDRNRHLHCHRYPRNVNSPSGQARCIPPLQSAKSLRSSRLRDSQRAASCGNSADSLDRLICRRGLVHRIPKSCDPGITGKVPKTGKLPHRHESMNDEHANRSHDDPYV